MTNKHGAPKELPEKPTGWTRKMLMHLSFGDGGVATFSIFDPEKKETPIGYQYDTRPGGLTGFTLAGVDGVMTWTELREKWPQLLAEKDSKP